MKSSVDLRRGYHDECEIFRKGVEFPACFEAATRPGPERKAVLEPKRDASGEVRS
jgi:hypothetical protein